MIWVPDKTGRFPQRPHYKPEEIDYECEAIVTKFLREKYDDVKLPMTTDDFTILIEKDVSALDMYADLSTDNDEDIEGVTEFFTDKNPAVLINKDLSCQSWREHRLRTTLSHEYGHVKFHSFLWRTYRPKLIWMLGCEKGPRCLRSTILMSPVKDWLEWQAGYASGAFLMPITYLKNIVGQFLKDKGCYQHVVAGSTEAQELVNRIADAFDVSCDAARVRLFQLKYLSEVYPTAPLL